jgi:hypothetical protein
MTSSPMSSYCFERGVRDRVIELVRCNGLDDPKLPRPKAAFTKLREETYRRRLMRIVAETVYSKRVAVEVAQPVLIN